VTTGWQIKPIGDAFRVVNGGTPKTGTAIYWDGEHHWITPAEMGGLASPYLSTSRRRLTDEGLRVGAELVPANSIILSTRAPIGHLVINEVPMAFNQGCKGLVPSSGIDSKFAYYFLLANVPLLDSLGTGATFKELSSSKLKEVLFRFPSLPEQHRIVAILDEAFEGIATAKANADKNLQNAGDVVGRSYQWIVESFDSSEWPVISVAGIAAARKGSMRTGPFGSQLLHGEFVDEGVAVLGIDNVVANEFGWDRRRYITQEKFRELARYRVAPGDVLISIMGTCGRCAVVPDDIPLAINSKHLCCITLDRQKCLPEFLHTYFLYAPMARDYLDKQAKGSIMSGLNMGIISELPVRLPPLAVQAAILDRFDSSRDACSRLGSIQEQKLAALDELKKSLLHQAFTGAL
jgi:type I restriction enzyme S subunit